MEKLWHLLRDTLSLRIKAILVWGGLYLWFNLVLLGLLFVLLFFNLGSLGEAIFESRIWQIIFFSGCLYILIKPIDFSKQLSKNQFLFFLYTGWIPFYIFLPTTYFDAEYDILTIFAAASLSLAIFRFEKWQLFSKATLIIFLWISVLFMLLSSILFPW